MKVPKIIKSIKDNTITIEEVLLTLAKDGYCPNLLNDDNGHWALKFDGFQTVPEEEPSDIMSSFYIRAEEWKDTIKEAVLYALKEE